MYQPRTEPRQHQREALQRIANKPSSPSDDDVFALLMEMGTGKSKVILDEFGERESRGEISDLLILAPAGAYGNWCRENDDDPGEIQKHVDPKLRKRMAVHQWKSGNSIGHHRALQQMFVWHGPRVLVMNIEALSSVKAAKNVCQDFLSRGRGMMVVDESTGIKSYKAKRTKAILEIAGLAKVRRIATGLVAPRSPMDIYTQYEFLDWRIIGLKSFFAFRARYAVMKKMLFGGRSVKVIVGYRNVDDLHQKIAPYSYRVLKEDCLDLDPKIYETRDVELTEEQVEAYNEIKNYATTQLEDGSYVTATAVITQMLRLHQLLCGHVVDEIGNMHHVRERRTDEIIAILEEHAGKAIIWTAYQESLRKISERLKKEFGPESTATFWGGNRSDRAQEEHRWKTDPRCRFMVATPAAGGKGNTWVQADLVIYHSNTYDLEARAQSEDRNHRDGQTRSVTYIDLVARGTVDERIIHALRKKIDIATTISGDNYREWLI